MSGRASRSGLRALLIAALLGPLLLAGSGPGGIRPTESSPLPGPHPAGSRVAAASGATAAPAGPLAAEGAGTETELRTVRASRPLLASRRSPTAGFTFLDTDTDGRVTRWDPCGVVHYTVNPTGAPAGGVADVRAAVAMVGRATGIRFHFDGYTGERLSTRRPELRHGAPPPGRNGFAPVLFGWYTYRNRPSATGADVVGYASPIAEYDGNQRVFVTGVIGLRADAGVAPGFDRSVSEGAVLLHEIGHLVGLGHAPRLGQLMYDRVGFVPPPVRYQAEDLAGLRLLGRTSGCLDSMLWARNR